MKTRQIKIRWNNAIKICIAIYIMHSNFKVEKEGKGEDEEDDNEEEDEEDEEEEAE